MLFQLNILSAQEISFLHLNTTHGLSDNLVSCAVRDTNGILWIGTSEGLNSYDGYTVKKYYKEDYPALTSNNIASLAIDDSNRIWVRNYLGKVTMIDEKRNFIAVPVLDKGEEVAAVAVHKTKRFGITVMSGNKIYALKKDKNYFFEKIKWEEDTSLVRGYIQSKNENNDTLVVISSNRFCVFDMANLKVLYKVAVPDIIGAAWLNDEELIVTTGFDRQLFKVNLPGQKITHNYAAYLKDQYGESVKGYLRHIRKMNDGKFIMTSGYGGVYVFDATNEKIYRYQHDPLNIRRISANNTAHVFADGSGYVYITTRSAGLNYFNTNHKLATYRSSFQETSTGKIFHGFINYVTRYQAGNYWMGTQTGLIEWDRNLNTIKFHDYGEKNGVPLNGVEEVRALCFDKQDKLWVGLNRYGIVVLDK